MLEGVGEWVMECVMEGWAIEGGRGEVIEGLLEGVMELKEETLSVMGALVWTMEWVVEWES